MNNKMWIWAVAPAFCCLMIAGCKQQAGEADSAVQQQVVEEEFFDTVELVTIDESPAVETQRATSLQTSRKTTPKTGNKTAARTKDKKASVQRNNGKTETLYVETEGAQGRVWGHVTMKGDRGTGTIHDWDENTWSVTVTRHGNELFAVDQNSRQYVFRIK